MDKDDIKGLFFKSGHKAPVSGEHSETSTEEKVETKKVNIYVNCSINHGRIFLFANPDQRPDVTALPSGEGQGDHVTSYIGFITAIVNSCDQATISGAPKVLRRIARAILPKVTEKFDGIPVAEKHDRIKRKCLTKALRLAQAEQSEIQNALQSFSDDHPLKVMALDILKVADHEPLFKTDLKRGGLVAYANELEALARTFLVEVQSEKKTAFPSKGRKNKDKGEGSRTKSAIYALSTINGLLKLMANLNNGGSDNDLPQNELLNLISEFQARLLQNDLDIIKLGLNKLYRMRLEVNKYSDSLKAAAKGTEERTKLKQKISKEAENETEKFAKLLEKDLGNLNLLKEHLMGLLEYPISPIEITISSLFIDLFDFQREVIYEKEKLKYTEIRKAQDLFELVARHIVVMFTAFDGIAQHLSSEVRQSITNELFKLILDKQGWDKCAELGEDKLRVLTKEVNARISITQTDIYLLSSEDDILISDLDFYNGGGSQNRWVLTFDSSSASGTKLKEARKYIPDWGDISNWDDIIDDCGSPFAQANRMSWRHG